MALININDDLVIDNKWTFKRTTENGPYFTRYGYGRYEPDNIHYALIARIEELEEELRVMGELNE